jgi:DNA-binding winged helix-turn-helix (wHTH) protein
MKAESLAISYRSSEVGQILAALRAGESCAVVGIGSVGKSNLLRSLQEKEVRRAKLGQEWDTSLFAYIDVNKSLKRSVWGLWELMLHQLMIEVTNQGADEVTLQTIDDLHGRATEPKTRYLALRYLDRAVSMVCNRLGWRLVFLIDEFDELCRTMPPRGFAALRALRDDHKYRLTYVVATRLELRRLREEISEIEAFEELVSPHTIWLGPYSEDDARFMLHRLEARHDVRLEEETTDYLLAATGGHPGLLRAGFRVAIEHPSNLQGMLASSSQVQDECRRIWLSLAPKEQRAVVSLVGDMEVQPHPTGLIEQLGHKGLVGGPWVSADRVFSPLFAEYIRQRHPVVGARVHIDRQRRTVWVDGRKIAGLAPLEYKLIEYLEGKRGQVCSRDELAECLYPEDMSLEGAGVTDTRIDSVVKRLRRRIEPNPKEPRFIVTVRGHGLRLADGDEANK